MTQEFVQEFDCYIDFHDKIFNCDAQLKSESCQLSPFKEAYEDMLREFERDCGEIKSITFVFKKK